MSSPAPSGQNQYLWRHFGDTPYQEILTFCNSRKWSHFGVTCGSAQCVVIGWWNWSKGILANKKEEERTNVRLDYHFFFFSLFAWPTRT